MAKKTDEQLQTEAVNALAWVLGNEIQTESGIPLEIRQHSFLIDPFMDNTSQVVTRKCAQIGWSTLAILRSIHLAYFYKANVVYTLPTRNVVRDFVIPKVDPVIRKNPPIRSLIADTNSISLKQIGDRFIYFRGTFEDIEAISISADILMMDEYDRSNQGVLQTYRSRLAASSYGWQHIFSNPSVNDYGVDYWWNQSDQKHWFIRMECGHDQWLKWPGNVDEKRGCYVCEDCGREITDQERMRGYWVAKYPERKEISGYWINHLMAPWVSAKRIIRESKLDPAYFHNFVLGLPYVPKDMLMDRAKVLRALVPDKVNEVNVVMGVDSGVEKWYVIGTPEGIFRYGKTESWDEIERLRQQYAAYLIIDPNPYPTKPKELLRKYPGKVYLAYYSRDRKTPVAVRWGKSVMKGGVLLDRTKVIDEVVAALSSQDLKLFLRPSEVEEYIDHWESIYRVITYDAQGNARGVWKRKENKPDHLVHATVLYRVGLEKVIHGETGGVQPSHSSHYSFPGVKRETVVVDPIRGGIPAIDLKKIAQRTVGMLKDWRYA